MDTLDASSGQILKALALLVAGGAFVWWQLRDVNRAQEASRRRRAEESAVQGPSTGGAPPPER
jgi:hypothetical protein